MCCLLGFMTMQCVTGDALQVQIDVSDTGDYDTGDHYNTEHARVRLNL
jgi:hypothetical protein